MTKGFKFKMAIFLTLLFIGALIGMNFQDKKMQREFKSFNESSINGKIIRIDKYSRGVNFVLNNDSMKYTFYPLANKQLNGNKIFAYFAEHGDSIYKSPFSDTLFLFKKNTKYFLKFQKF